MAKHKLDREEIMSFLLGELEEAETSRIESMFLSDPTYSEAIEKAKSQLYEEYKSGRMSPAQSGRFESRLLPDLDEDKKKFQAMLDRNEERRTGGEDATPKAEENSAAVAKRSAASVYKGSSSVLPKLLVLAVLAVGAFAAVFVLKGQDKEKGTAPVTLPVFSVQGQSQVIVLPPGSQVDLLLALPPETSSQNFTVAAYNSGTESLWSAKRVSDEVHVTVKRTTLADGRYDLELRTSDAAEAGIVGYYSFQK